MRIECESTRNVSALWIVKWRRHQTRRQSSDQRRNHVRQLPAATSPPKIRSLPSAGAASKRASSRRTWLSVDARTPNVRSRVAHRQLERARRRPIRPLRSMR